MEKAIIFKNFTIGFNNDKDMEKFLTELDKLCSKYSKSIGESEKDWGYEFKTIS